MTDHMPMSKVSRLEVIETGARRRWSVEEKLRILAESERGARQVSATARRYGLSKSQLFIWRRLARQGSRSELSHLFTNVHGSTSALAVESQFAFLDSSCEGRTATSTPNIPFWKAWAHAAGRILPQSLLVE